MSNAPEFRRDLYRGTARFYDEFRLPYPRPLLDDLLARARITGSGRLLDLACGTGQIAFELAPYFTEVFAVDQEEEAIELARANALERGVDSIQWIAGRAEDVDADGDFELVTIGNAFHRLPRALIAGHAARWLTPGGHLALIWSNPPWDGREAWQRTLADTMERWRRDADEPRVPANLAEHLAEQPHPAVLEAAGFAVVGTFDFPTAHAWSIDSLTGLMFSTSVLSQPALGKNVEPFERDVRSRLLAVCPDGVFRETVSFSYTLARGPSRLTP